jgi:mono/diheme cytochrome c family protein
MKTSTFSFLAIIAMFGVWAAPATNAQTKPLEANAEAGRALALRACTGCHVVAPDQPFKPVYTGPPRPPDFKEIANQSNLTAASLRHHLETLPVATRDLSMANPELTSQQTRDVVAFIVTLRDNPKGPTQ